MTDRGNSWKRHSWTRHSWSRRLGASALALAMAGVVGAGTAFAGHGGHGCGKRDHGKLEEKIGALGLNSETKAAVDQVLAEARTTREARHQELRTAREQMRTLLSQDAPAVEAVMAQADTIGALQTEARKQKLQTMLSLRELIGAEQWKQLGFGERGRHGFGKDHGLN